MDLNSIITGSKPKPPTIFLYGVEGVGKTTFAASAPSPIFIPTEDGIGRLDVPRFPLCKNHGEVVDCIRCLAQGGHEFRTVVLDSADWLERLIWDSLSTLPAPDTAYGKGYQIAADILKNILSGLTYLRDELGMTVIVLGHAQVKTFKSPEGADFDRYMPKLQERASSLLREWCDVLLFANYQISASGGKGVSSGARYIYAEEKPAFYAKNRFNLPDRMPLSWDAFSQALYGENK